MTRSVHQYKNEARREEKRENWARAIELYHRAIRLAEETGEHWIELSLYNRVGDLYRRLGDVARAVDHYLEAVDRYAGQGLHTGAIALCNKILRIQPSRTGVHRRLGALQAAAGLHAEARRSFETYLEQAKDEGPEHELEVRLECARLTRDLGAILELADRLVGEGRREEASEALERFRSEARGRELAGNGSEEGLEKVSARLEGLRRGPGTRGSGLTGTDPGTVAPDPEPEAEPEAEPVTSEPMASEAEGALRDPEAAAPEPARSDPQPEPAAGGEPESAGTEPEPAAGVGDGSSEFDRMLVGFRAQAAETHGEADPMAHVELGVALRQMGRLEDAIREFQRAARSARPPLAAFEALGACFLDMKLDGVAVRVLTRALRLPGHPEHELLGILYRLGLAYERMGSEAEALDCFERVYSVDIDFRDVAQRMASVRREL